MRLTEKQIYDYYDSTCLAIARKVAEKHDISYHSYDQFSRQVFEEIDNFELEMNILTKGEVHEVIFCILYPGQSSYIPWLTFFIQYELMIK